MNKPLILVVEDDSSVKNLITTTLKAHDYRFLAAGNGETAILDASSHNPDIVLLDLAAGYGNGIEVIRKIRSWSNMPIIVISARSEDTDKIDALDAGADDYLTKPFSVEELLARLRVTQRRLLMMRNHSLAETSVFIKTAHFVLITPPDVHFWVEKSCILPRLNISCSACCQEMLERYSLDTYITQNIWGSSWENDIASLRVFMATLRKKLEKGRMLPSTSRHTSEWVIAW